MMLVYATLVLIGPIVAVVWFEDWRTKRREHAERLRELGVELGKPWPPGSSDPSVLHAMSVALGNQRPDDSSALARRSAPSS
jgi:hypothetical protein